MKLEQQFGAELLEKVKAKNVAIHLVEDFGLRR
jgi:hypothetical protein